MNKYNHSRVYKIKCLNTGKEYYGSTIELLSQRIARHRKYYKSFLEDKHNYISSFDILQEGNFIIELVEECNFNNNDELRQREQYYIDLHPDAVNRMKAHITPEEKKAQRDKDNLLYRTRHPDEYKAHIEDRKTKVLCKCGCEVSKRNMARHIKTQH